MAVSASDVPSTLQWRATGDEDLAEAARLVGGPHAGRAAHPVPGMPLAVAGHGAAAVAAAAAAAGEALLALHLLLLVLAPLHLLVLHAPALGVLARAVLPAPVVHRAPRLDAVGKLRAVRDD